MCVLVSLPFFVLGQEQKDVQLANEYLLKGEKLKAAELYRELAKNSANTALIHNNFINTLIDLAEFNEAQDYLKKLLKREPEQLLFKLDVGRVMMRSGEVQKADKYFKDLIQESKQSLGRIKIMNDYFMARSLFDYAIIALLESRDELGNPAMYCLELATLYRIKGEKEKMTEEYLNYATQNVGNSQYIKNVLQVLLTKPEELEVLEALLYRKVQEDPEQQVYTDLLIWVMLQQKNFYGAFVQARAYDRRYKTGGTRSLEIAEVALNNKDYENASRIFRFVKDAFKNNENQQEAQLGYIRSREARLRDSYPIQKDSVETLITAYWDFIKQNPKQPVALDALRNIGVMKAEYLQETDTAIAILTKLIADAYTPLQIKSRAKLDLADIYIFKEEPWEAALLYAQVEKTHKETTLAYEAKLKNAKLSYYRGDFMLAQEHLDILKEATTREIANDAMDLSMRIKENIAIDSAGLALREFAKVELLLKQNKMEEALARLSSIQEGHSLVRDLDKEDKFLRNIDPSDTVYVTFTNYAIKDDCYWLEAQIKLRQNKPEEAQKLLQKILEEYPEDILADDAFFTIGEIYERHLNDKDKAMDQYQKMLAQYPGSVYVAEARKRFRELRGDFKQEEPKL
ncbi:tetratricopeptide repeat protein [Chryseotalea sanaruensis]|uniref:tetratricopeptide repeat protein n=1 Tax=Chryseotalea sanaruensis TaxID=2482724 RepID=UPI00135C168F|nr:tetratricopeptide repeat protein [Chryseotalea sanaruensis]